MKELEKGWVKIMDKQDVLEAIDKYYQTPTKKLKSQVVHKILDSMEKKFTKGFDDFNNCWCINIEDYMEIKKRYI